MSKNKILKAIQENKPKVSVQVPEFNPKIGTHNLAKAFVEKTNAIGGQCELFSDWDSLKNWIVDKAEDLTGEMQSISISSPVENLQEICTLSLDTILDPVELNGVDLAIVEGQVGVAENGAVWLSEKEMKIRVLPFITQHLVLIIELKDIVNNMHEAYQKIKIDETGFGVFIAGPSKTADIEQSLVIGAQAARSCTVLIIDK